jgi:hypothetical protein
MVQLEHVHAGAPLTLEKTSSCRIPVRPIHVRMSHKQQEINKSEVTLTSMSKR